jgi:hypothetical protein
LHPEGGHGFPGFNGASAAGPAFATPPPAPIAPNTRALPTMAPAITFFTFML